MRSAWSMMQDTVLLKKKSKKNNIEKLINELKSKKITPNSKGLELLNNINTTEIKDIINLLNEYNNDVLEQVEISIKYEGYIKKALKDAERFNELDSKKIPADINYHNIKNLASEARQKLEQIRPTSIGQAMRISGVNPVDISLIMVYIKKEYFYDRKWIY